MVGCSQRAKPHRAVGVVSNVAASASSSRHSAAGCTMVQSRPVPGWRMSRASGARFPASRLARARSRAAVIGGPPPSRAKPGMAKVFRPTVNAVARTEQSRIAGANPAPQDRYPQSFGRNVRNRAQGWYKPRQPWSTVLSSCLRPGRIGCRSHPVRPLWGWCPYCGFKSIAKWRVGFRMGPKKSLSHVVLFGWLLSGEGGRDAHGPGRGRAPRRSQPRAGERGRMPASARRQRGLCPSCPPTKGRRPLEPVSYAGKGGQWPLSRACRHQMAP